MSLFSGLLEKLRARRPRRAFQVDAELVTLVEQLAARQHLPSNEVAADLLQAALTRAYDADLLWQAWESLSPREKQATAFSCLGYTNRQIAARLHLSVDTVKTHMRSVLVKFGLHSKAELRRILADWDFSDWGIPHR